MKKFFVLLSALAVILSLNCVFAEEEAIEQTKTEQVIENISAKTQVAAEKTADSVKSGSKKAGKYIKEKSIIVGEKTAKHAKSGAKKVKKATVRGANKVSNSTAKGLKKAGEKMQSSAERTIEKTDKTLQETAPKCKCKCDCGENCKCHEENKSCEE
jgi:hypothetical protein